jgi:hypothetical protein
MRMSAQQQRDRARFEEYKTAAADLLDQLRALGFEVETVGELYASRKSYKRAIPTLISWLGRVENERVETELVRALTDRAARPDAAAPLVARFRELGPDAPELGLKWHIAHALATVADDSVFVDIAQLIDDERHGRAREWLVVALTRTGDPRASDVAVQALEDPDLTPFALRAIGAIKEPRLLPLVKRYADDPNALVRREARTAIRHLEKVDV